MNADEIGALVGSGGRLISNECYEDQPYICYYCKGIVKC